MNGDHPIRTATSAAELSELEAEPGFMAALAVAWRGDGSVEDAVHWRLHPTVAARSGRPDPAAQLIELRARAYSRPVEIEHVVEVRDTEGRLVRLSESEARLMLFERGLERRSRLLDDAIAAVLRNELPGGDSDERADLAPGGPGLFARMLRRHPVVVFGTAAALLSALVIPVAAAGLASDLTPSAGLLKIFNRPQSAMDIAPQVFTGGQPGATQRVRDTTRYLGEFSGVRVFAYLDSPDQVCLLSTAPTDHDVTVCASTRAFARTGLSIAPVNYQVDSNRADAAVAVTTSSQLAFRWGPDADLAVRVVR
jgi:hypothetical protein